MATNTEVETETETETETLTRSASACTMGAGGAAFFCKGILLSFLTSALALIGLSSVSHLWLMVGVLAVAGVFVWKGFEWAGRRPVLLGLGGLVTIWAGYITAGVIYTPSEIFSTPYYGPTNEAIAANMMGLIPVALLYIAGGALFFAAIYDSYMKELDITSSKGGMAGGILATGICGGGPFTLLAAGGMVFLIGPSTTQFLAYHALLVVGVVALLGYALYAGAWKQTAVAAAGAFIAFLLTGSLFSFPAEGGLLGMLGITIPSTAAGTVIGSSVMLGGLAIMFYGLIWAYYPDMQVVPPKWKATIVGRDQI